MNYIDLCEKEPQCETTTVTDKQKPFIGFPIRSQYDVKRLSIPKKYNPVYIKDENGQTYYGVFGEYTLGGVQLYNDLLQTNCSKLSNVVKVLDKWNIDICNSYRYTTNKVVSLNFETNKIWINDMYKHIDTHAFNHSEAPSYIKVAGMYIFIFLP